MRQDEHRANRFLPALPSNRRAAGGIKLTRSRFAHRADLFGFSCPPIKLVEEQLVALRSSLICAFNQLLDLKDLNTGVHSTRLVEWALRVAGELGLNRDSLGDIEVAALLHDIGKIGISDSILNKPSKLTSEE